MKCLYCSCTDSKVVDSRAADDDKAIRRRRECTNCGKRFTTYETVEITPIFVIKSSGARQAFDPNKLKNGIIKACEKRPVSLAQIDEITNSIEFTIQNSLDREVTSVYIGELAMDKLKAIDEVAYVRFASVYRQFKDINTFMEELTKLLAKD